MKNWKILLMAVLALSLMAYAFGCATDDGSGSGEVKGDTSGSSFENGAKADVELEILEDGTLYATSIEFDDEEEDDDDCECEQEGEHEGENEDCDCEDDDEEDVEDDEDEEGDHQDDDDEDDDDDDDEGDKEEFDALVEEVGEDYFVVFGDLVVMMEPDDGDEDEGDEEDDEGEVDYEISDLTVGTWVEVKGAYDAANNIFYAEEIKGQEDGENEFGVESIIENLGDASFTMLGMTITYDSNTTIEGENDGVDCEQEGEHEGENEGC